MDCHTQTKPLQRILKDAHEIQRIPVGPEWELETEGEEPFSRRSPKWTQRRLALVQIRRSIHFARYSASATSLILRERSPAQERL